MKILFVYYKNMASFIRGDLEILRKKHEVQVIRFSTLLDAYSLCKGACWCDAVFAWFGSIHAFFSVLLSGLLARKSVVVAGGYDVAYLPGIKYGPFSLWWKRWFARFIFRFADRVLTVSKSNTQDALKNARARPESVRLVHLGFDSSICGMEPNTAKKDMVLCVSKVSKTNVMIKGLDLLARSSRFLPEVKFVLVGRWIDDSVTRLQTIVSSNMQFLDEMDQATLFQMMSQCKVYVQVSRHESFGCALAEAMLCGCIPVVSRSGAFPEVVGDCGFFLSDPDPEKLAVLIRKALNSDPELGRRARERIINLFPLEKRERALLEIVEGARD